MAAACAKIILVIVNIIFTVFGLGFLVGGVFVRVGEEYYSPELDKFEKEIPDIAQSGGFQDVSDDDSSGEKSLDIGGILQNLAVVLIVFGLFMLITGILGMCGACCANRCMLVVYIIIVALIFLAQLCVFIVLLTNTFEDQMKNEMKDMIKNKYGGIDDFTVESISLNYVMLDFECCGIDNYKDFDNARKWDRSRVIEINGYNQTVELATPLACCKTDGKFPNIDIVSANCTFDPNSDNSNYKKGCWNEIEDSLSGNKAIFIGIFAAILVFELICLILAGCIIKKSGKDDEHV